MTSWFLRHSMRFLIVVILALSLPANAKRMKDPLERFDLETLQLWKVWKNECGAVRGYVIDPDGYVHSVKVGEYAGRNFGIIIDISETRLELLEVHETTEGRWEERKAYLMKPNLHSDHVD